VAENSADEATEPKPTPGVLDGVRVLDFGRYVAGPFCAALLADLGAEVIRIDRVGGSEDRLVMPTGEAGIGSLFLHVNRNKLSMTLAPQTDGGRKVLDRLVATSDVVVANMPQQTLEQMGIDYESLKSIKPDIILTSVSAFGNGGPNSNRLGFDGIGQAMSGAAYLSGHADQPVKAYVPYVDYSTAMCCAFGTLAALMARAQSGQGQVVEGSLLATALTIINPTLIEQALTGADRTATLNRSQIYGPSDIFRTRDGWDHRAGHRPVHLRALGTPGRGGGPDRGRPLRQRRLARRERRAPEQDDGRVVPRTHQGRGARSSLGRENPGRARVLAAGGPG
jgi:crotonobetainyl-CoA:carnitine CoA-transferase CaiB-like acyl-CoA transferase